MDEELEEQEQQREADRVQREVDLLAQDLEPTYENVGNSSFS